MDNKLAEAILHIKVEEYLKNNPERFNATEKSTFRLHFSEWLNTNSNVIYDDVEDFLVHIGAYKHTSRANRFADYIISKYPLTSYKTILDVGAGRICRVSSILGNKGYHTSAIDPNIRLENKELKERKIKSIIKRPFYCDDYSKGNNGTNICKYDLLIGLEPCEATEHIIRQGLKYDKPFDIRLCYSEHNGLDGTKCNTPTDWYKHLSSISREVHITRVGSSYHATNLDSPIIEL